LSLFFAGHDHTGGFAIDKYGIGHVTLQSPLECPLDNVAFGYVRVYEDRLTLEGFGTVPSRIIFFLKINSKIQLNQFRI